jgi:hypothetical protein
LIRLCLESEIKDKERNEDAEKKRIIGAGKGLKDEKEADSKQVPVRRLIKKLVQIQEAERHPAEKEKLKVADMGEMIGEESKDQAGQDCRSPGFTEMKDEPVGPESPEEKRENKEKVIGQEDIASDQDQRKGHQGERRKVIGIEKRPCMREKDIPVPKTAQSGSQFVMLPGQDPDIIERITEVGRH